MNPLAEPLAAVVGGSTAQHIAKAWPQVTTVGDLLDLFPTRYHPRGELSDTDALTVGEYVTVVGRVGDIDVRPMRGRRGDVSTVHIELRGRTITATFFNQGQWIRSKLSAGSVWMFAGKVEAYRDQLQLSHPEVEKIDDAGAMFDDDVHLTPQQEAELAFLAPSLQASAFVRIYPSATYKTAGRGGRPGRQRTSISNNQLGLAVATILQPLDTVPDPVPDDIRERHGMPDLLTAYRMVHLPQSREEITLGRRRFAFAEALTLQTLLARRRHRVRSIGAVPRAGRSGGLADAFDALLPYELTDGQRRVGDQIAADLARPEPMSRLLQGDVGSGKTVVALRAMLSVVDAGGQAALLAPTEVLAAQHARLVRSLLGPLGRAGELDAPDQATTVALLTGSLTAAQRREALGDIASGAAGIVIGTHALLSDDVAFAELGFIVVDEQHRFGVEQRSALLSRARSGDQHLLAHLLVMTATPIPRTIAMTVFGDLDVSTLTEIPAGRQEVSTTVVPALERPSWLDRTWARIAEEVAEGRQAYVVCPRIGGGEGDDDVAAVDGALVSPLDAEAADPDALAERWTVTDLLPVLRDHPALRGLRIEPLTGRMPSDEKDATMRAFAEGRIDVLLSTTVIEVGVDVPNATLMAVMAADRFGLSQLHQLRGRVGRGAHPGLCLLVTTQPDDSPSRARLQQLAETADGFQVAEIDLHARSEGNVLGETQHGRSRQLRYLRVIHDLDVLDETRMDAFALVADDPDLTRYPLLDEACRVLDEGEGTFLDMA